MKRLIILGAIVLTGVAGYTAYRHWLYEAPLPDGLIQANGRIEGDRVIIASKFAGRVSKLLVREGDSVALDQVLLQLDDAQVAARLDQAKKGIVALEAQLQAAQHKLAQAQRDVHRIRDLAASGTATKHEQEEAELAWDVARDQLAALNAQLDQARAKQVEAESVLADLTIRAPIDGTISTRMVDGGEVIGAGTPLLSLVNMDRLYLKVYVAEANIGKVRQGLPARIYIDAFPDHYFDARVRYIASQAEFTPKEVQTPDERVKLVYAVKLYLDENPEHRLTPGLPADAVIRWEEDAPWAKPRW